MCDFWTLQSTKSICFFLKMASITNINFYYVLAGKSHLNSEDNIDKMSVC